MTIHFVCTGNTYRSRLAETYLKSLQIPNILVISSGIKASRNISGPISWITQRIIQKNKLVPFEKDKWQETSKELLDQGDLTIFMMKNHLNFCKENFNFNRKYEVWDIPDLDISLGSDERTEANEIKASEQTFEAIKQKVDQLVTNY